jgi:hypothetical protein
MGTSIKFTNCPSANDFDRYLNNSGPAEFTKAFDDHLSHCALCSESIEGYKLSGTSPANFKLHNRANKIFNENKRLNSWITWGSIAAGLIIIVGLSTLIWPYQTKFVSSSNSIDDPGFIPDNTFGGGSTGRLMNKLNEDYWYVCDQDIFINDQEIGASEINAVIENLNPSKPLIIEVGCSCDERIDQLVQKIKNGRNINVYIYSKNSRIRPKYS